MIKDATSHRLVLGSVPLLLLIQNLRQGKWLRVHEPLLSYPILAYEAVPRNFLPPKILITQGVCAYCCWRCHSLMMYCSLPINSVQIFRRIMYDFWKQLLHVDSLALNLRIFPMFWAPDIGISPLKLVLHCFLLDSLMV